MNGPMNAAKVPVSPYQYLPPSNLELLKSWLLGPPPGPDWLEDRDLQLWLRYDIEGLQEQADKHLSAFTFKNMKMLGARRCDEQTFK